MAGAVNICSEEYKLGQQIHRYRKLHQWTQNDLADRMDMDRSAIANYENGTKGEMGFKTLKRFSAALGVSVDVLLGDGNDEDLEDNIAQLNEENKNIIRQVASGLLLKQQMTA
jgi:transcriptional regulator with XRE-family HTH domain